MKEQIKTVKRTDKIDIVKMRRDKALHDNKFASANRVANEANAQSRKDVAEDDKPDPDRKPKPKPKPTGEGASGKLSGSLDSHAVKVQENSDVLRALNIQNAALTKAIVDLRGSLRGKEGGSAIIGAGTLS